MGELRYSVRDSTTGRQGGPHGRGRRRAGHGAASSVRRRPTSSSTPARSRPASSPVCGRSSWAAPRPRCGGGAAPRRGRRRRPLHVPPRRRRRARVGRCARQLGAPVRLADPRRSTRSPPTAGTPRCSRGSRRRRSSSAPATSTRPRSSSASEPSTSTRSSPRSIASARSTSTRRCGRHPRRSHGVPGMAEYADAKRAGEAAAASCGAAPPPPRPCATFPRLRTDQTASFVPVDDDEPGPHVLAALRELRAVTRADRRRHLH